MTPAPAVVRHAVAPTSLGDLLLTTDGEALTGIYFPGHTYPPTAAQTGTEVAVDGDALLATAAAQLREYLAGQRRAFELPTAPAGDVFSHRVWALLRAIPYGATTTYGALARELGSAGLAQRVGQAVGHNPLSIVVPCHRVLGVDGSLTGFAGGLARKRTLLELEEDDDARASRLF